ncbi:MAG: hypothetical protein IPL61_36115 [Myxococcales bacterium]|nr:hypothetical protein [Myxococcales bacterium]
MRRFALPTLASVIAGSLLAGCPDRSLSEVDPIPENVEKKSIPVKLNRNIDILFIVDDSGSMIEEQAGLTANFPAFINVLNTIEGGFPDAHIGVVSTNVGTGGVNIGGCSSASQPQGDDGNLQTNACAGLTAAYIEDIQLADGTRQRNYSGDLSMLFGCMARLGTTGCGFEAPLESAYRALQPGKNAGFLRPNALLALIFITDEDDCSTKGDGQLFGDPNGTIASPLGPRTSFRCTEFGVECPNDTNPRAFGTRTGCQPRTNSQYMKDVQPYVDYFKSLKPDDDKKVVVAGIIGNVDDQSSITVGPDPDDATRPALLASCSSASGNAVPAIRMKSFLESFPTRNTTTTVCNDNLADAMTQIADLLKLAVGNPCIEAELSDRNPTIPGVQPECSVSDVTDPNGVNRMETIVPSCDVSGGAVPCWRFISDPVRCADAPANRAIEVDRGGVSVPDNTVLEVQCVTI